MNTQPSNIRNLNEFQTFKMRAKRYYESYPKRTINEHL